MSAKKGMPESHATHPNVVPLIDIIMCLIVFFMLAAKIGVSKGEDQKITIPQTIRGAKLELSGSLIVNVKKPALGGMAPDVTAMVGGAVTELKIDAGGGKNQLYETLRFLRYGEDGKPGGSGKNADNEKFKLIIRADEDLDYRFLEPVLLAAANAGVVDMAYQTKPLEVRKTAE
jgi:biopolymer transport protein ExbD